MMGDGEFRCHVCGVASAGPFRVNEAEVDWNLPADLLRCEVCQRWCCRTHIKNMGYESWWICIVCYNAWCERIAQEAGDNPNTG
jgi:hypothetical protein